MNAVTTPALRTRELQVVPIETLSEWLVVWEAISQYVDNSEEEIADPKVHEALASAISVLERMDAIFARMNGG